jgi:hypothetical protein
MRGASVARRISTRRYGLALTPDLERSRYRTLTNQPLVAVNAGAELSFVGKGEDMGRSHSFFAWRLFYLATLALVFLLGLPTPTAEAG